MTRYDERMSSNATQAGTARQRLSPMERRISRAMGLREVRRRQATNDDYIQAIDGSQARVVLYARLPSRARCAIAVDAMDPHSARADRYWLVIVRYSGADQRPSRSGWLSLAHYGVSLTPAPGPWRWLGWLVRRLVGANR